VRIIFTAVALRELRDAAGYLNQQFEGLGEQFQDDVRVAAKRIAEFPNAWSIERGEVRKCLLLRFPYKLLHSIESDHIAIVAVANQHRRPDYWVDREEK
jgi:plasmid stabilization system protein ParE